MGLKNTPNMDWTSKENIGIDWFDGRREEPIKSYVHQFDSAEEARMFADRVLTTNGFGYVTITFENGDVERLDIGE